MISPAIKLIVTIVNPAMKYSSAVSRKFVLLLNMIASCLQFKVSLGWGQAQKVFVLQNDTTLSQS